MSTLVNELSDSIEADVAVNDVGIDHFQNMQGSWI